jgi:hypothetical protein
MREVSRPFVLAREKVSYNETKSKPLATVSPRLDHHFRNCSEATQIAEEMKQVCIIVYIKLSS